MTTVAEHLISLTGSAPATAADRWRQSGTGNTTGERLLSHAGLSSGTALYLMTQWFNLDPKALLIISATLRSMWLQARSVLTTTTTRPPMQNIERTSHAMLIAMPVGVDVVVPRTILIPKE